MSLKKYNITVNGKVYEVEIEEVKQDNIKDTTSKKVEKVKVEKTMETKKVTNLTNNQEGDVNAPMPGTILNILVKKGQNIKKGQVIAILEAMKMENEIVSPIDGTVDSISVDKGQNVSLGDSLLKIV